MTIQRNRGRPNFRYSNHGASIRQDTPVEAAREVQIAVEPPAAGKARSRGEAKDDRPAVEEPTDALAPPQKGRKQLSMGNPEGW